MSTPNTPAPHPAGLPPVDDAQLMAYVDGALAPGEARAVAEAVARDAALAARAERMRQAGRLTREVLDAPEVLAVPPALRAAVQAMAAAQTAQRTRQGSGVAETSAGAAVAPAPAGPASVAAAASASVAANAAQAHPAAPTAAPIHASMPNASAPRARPHHAASPRWWQRLRDSFSALTVPMAVACSVFFGVAGFQLGRAPTGNEATLALAVGQTASPALAALLDRLPSGAQGEAAGTPVALVASFRDAGGALCRDFSVEAAQSPRFEAVACRAPGSGAQGWELRYAAAAPTEAGGYAPASASAALDRYLASIGANEALDVQAEQAALAGLAKR